MGDGVVLSSINGRAETRTYAKPVVAGQGEQELSPEEAQAVHCARPGRGVADDQVRRGPCTPQVARDGYVDGARHGMPGATA